MTLSFGATLWGSSAAQTDPPALGRSVTDGIPGGREIEIGRGRRVAGGRYQLPCLVVRERIKAEVRLLGGPSSATVYLARRRDRERDEGGVHMRRIISLSVSVALGLTALAGAPVAATIYEGDQSFRGDTQVLAGDVIKGNVTITDGTLIVYGRVEGDVMQRGDGDVRVVAMFGPAVVTGDVDERDDGDVVVGFTGAVVAGDVHERDGGYVAVGQDGIVGGNVVERGPGDVSLDGYAAIEGDVAEQGPGDMLVLWNSLVGGDVCERGPGAIMVDATSEVVGGQAC